MRSEIIMLLIDIFYTILVSLKTYGFSIVIGSIPVYILFTSIINKERRPENLREIKFFSRGGQDAIVYCV